MNEGIHLDLDTWIDLIIIIIIIRFFLVTHPGHRGMPSPGGGDLLQSRCLDPR